MTAPTFTLNPDRSVTLAVAAVAGTSRLVVAKRSEPEAHLQFYGPVGEAFGGYGAAQFAAALEDVKGSRAVTLYMSSDGGDFFEGIAIYSQIARFAESHDFTIVVDGIAASAASVVAMAAKRLVMAPAAKLMIHEARSAKYGTKAEQRKLADLLEGADKTMADIYSKRSGLSVEQIRAFFANGDTYFTAAEAVELGFADAVEGEDPAPKKRAAAASAPSSERLIAAARINSQLAKERREAASRDPEPGQPGTK